MRPCSNDAENPSKLPDHSAALKKVSEGMLVTSASSSGYQQLPRNGAGRERLRAEATYPKPTEAVCGSMSFVRS